MSGRSSGRLWEGWPCSLGGGAVSLAFYAPLSVIYLTPFLLSSVLLTAERLPLTFKEATDLLIQRLTVADVAKACGSHVNSVERARLDPKTRSYREPPTGWIPAVARLARHRGMQLISLAERLEKLDISADR